jgi:hypothetical protein
MRKSLFVLGFLVLLAMAPAAFAECCSCKAPDGSCNASVCCSNGCSAICGSGGKCSASCSGGGLGDITPAQPTPLRTAPGEMRVAPGPSDPISERVSLQVVNITAEEVSALVSNLAEREITFVPSTPDERFSINTNDFPVGELVSALAEHGAVGSVPRRMSIADVQLNDRVSLEAKGVSGATLAEMVASLTNGRAVLVPTDAAGVINLEVKNLRLGEFLHQIAIFGDVTLDGQEIAPR